MTIWEDKTYDIIKPVWEITGDGAKTIAGWHVCARVMAKSEKHALDFARQQYGADIDIRLVTHSVKA